MTLKIKLTESTDSDCPFKDGDVVWLPGGFNFYDGNGSSFGRRAIFSEMKKVAGSREPLFFLQDVISDEGLTSDCVISFQDIVEAIKGQPAKAVAKYLSRFDLNEDEIRALTGRAISNDIDKGQSIPTPCIQSAASIQMAEQQLTGFFHARAGFSLESLAEGMGLTQEEWVAVKENGVLTIEPRDIESLDSYFNSRKSPKP